ncbi:extracellular solute-binding protein [Rhizobium sp. CF142]|uniref:extracellular solute-binding protein n=1 Tax=Rhizobium sp. CF142 TaxID=1144314 RepID=UPI00026EEC2F|nr:extracellular solute-binding protein [Rhizobium sp. CF142]EJJ26714.1 spermidine/putrescine-binding periplasmic protein [Rhizobium sp. CF142]
MTTRNSSPILTSALTRRSFAKTLAAGVLATPFVNRYVSSAQAQAQGTGVVNFANYGGSYGDAMREIWFDPFEKETGIKVNSGVGASLALAKLQLQNPSGAEWDIVDLTNAGYINAVKQGILLPLDKNLVDTSQLIPEYVGTHGFCYVTFVLAMGWNKATVKESPSSWAELWDKSKYKGKRSLGVVNTAGDAIEVALLADGVATSAMYPIDVDRAFASLDKLGRDNIVWNQTLQEPVQRIGSNETPVGAIYTGRAIMANRGGANIGFSVKQGIVGGDSLGVISNSKNKKEAFTLLNFMATRGDLAAKFAAKTSYGMPHMQIESLLPKDADDVRVALPTNPDLLKSGLIVNDTWWADNLAAIVNRYQEWQLG